MCVRACVCMIVCECLLAAWGEGVDVGASAGQQVVWERAWVHQRRLGQRRDDKRAGRRQGTSTPNNL